MTFLIVLNSGCSKGNDQISESSLQEEISEISETASEKPGTVETISIENADILMEKNTFPFTEKPIIPVFSVKVNGKELTKSTDYLLEYADNTRPGNQTAIIRIKGSGAYSGSREVRFSILPPVPSAVNISENGEAVNVNWDICDYADGYSVSYCRDKTFETDVSEMIITDGNTAELSADYSAGEMLYVRVCSFIGDEDKRLFSDYSDIQEIEIKGIIGKVSLSETEFVYDGKLKCPEVTVYSSKGEILEENKDYTLRITGREEPGTGYAVVTGINNYSGTVTEGFTVIQAENSVEVKEYEPDTSAPAYDGSIESLESRLRAMIKNYVGDWSIYLRDLKTGETISINNRSIYPASLMKLFGMAAAYQAIEDGRISEDALYELLESMITVSDNDAFNQIVRKIGVTSVSDWINANGYNETYQCAGFVGGNNYSETVIAPGFNRTSAADCGRLLESIYNGECVSPWASKRMLELLKAQKLTSKIPSVIPEGIVTANKTGEYLDTNHDCAIVFLEDHPYVLCVLSESDGAYMEYTWCIQEISKEVFDFMSDR